MRSHLIKFSFVLLVSTFSLFQIRNLEVYSQVMQVDQGQESSEDFFTQGIQKLYLGVRLDLQGAIEDFTAAINLKSDYDLAFYHRGIAYLKQDDFESAREDFTTCISLNANYTLAYYQLGITYFEQEKFQQAIANFTEALKIDSKHPNPYFKRGVVYSLVGNLENAINDYIAVIQLLPDNRADWKGDIRAVRMYDQLIQEDIQLAHIYYQVLAQIYFENRLSRNIYGETLDIQQESFVNGIEMSRGALIIDPKKEEILETLNSLIRLKPNFADAYYYRGLFQGTPEEAISDFTKALQEDQDFANAYYRRAEVHFYQQNFLKAIQDYSQAIQIESNYADSYYRRGLAFSRLSNSQRAVSDFIQSINIEAFRYTSNEEVAKDYIRIFSRKPIKAEDYYRRGIARHALKDSEGAFSDYTKAIQLKPDFSEAYFARGQARPQNIFQLEGQDDATSYELIKYIIKDYDKAISLEPEMAKAYLARGQVRVSYPSESIVTMIRLGQRTETEVTEQDMEENELKLLRESIEDYTKAISLEPELAEAYLSRASANAMISSVCAWRNNPRSCFINTEKIKQDVKQVIRLGWNRDINYFERRMYKFARIVNRLFSRFFPVYGDLVNLHTTEEEARNNTQPVINHSSIPDPFYQRGVSSLNHGEYTQAIDNFSRAIELNPQDGDSYYKRALANYSLQKYQDSIIDCNEAINLNFNLRNVCIPIRSFALFELGNYIQAGEDSKLAAQLNPTVNTPHYLNPIPQNNPMEGVGEIVGNLASYELSSQEVEENSHFYSTLMFRWWLPIPPFGASALSSQISLAPAYYDTGRRLERQGDLEGAIRNFQKAASIFLTNGDQSQYQEILDRIENLRLRLEFRLISGFTE